MARLKGGKLFLDLNLYVQDGEISNLQLSDEEYNCVLSKGLVVKILDFVIPVVFTTIDYDNNVAYASISVRDGAIWNVDTLTLYLQTKSITLSV